MKGCDFAHSQETYVGTHVIKVEIQTWVRNVALHRV